MRPQETTEGILDIERANYTNALINMGSKKQIKAEKLKEDRQTTYFAKLSNCPTSPRKRVEKLLLSAIANWQVKNEGIRIEDSNLYIKKIDVDSARQLKRIRPAPQGRAHRIRKRSNHVTLVLDSIQPKEEEIKNN